MAPLTLYEKIWNAHAVHEVPGQPALLYIDRHLIHEGTSPQAFAALKAANRKVRRPDLTFAVMDHSVPTKDRQLPIVDDTARAQFDALARNCAETRVRLFDMHSSNQGIVHIIGPELGITQPGQTIVCGDSHTSTHGAFGTLAFGIGTSEVEHVLATQCLQQFKSKTIHVRVEGKRLPGTTAKDIILAIIGEIGVAGGTGHVLEYAGEAVRALSMEGRMTMCNMSIECGARAGMVAPDEVTFDYLEGRPMAPTGSDWERAVEDWKTLRTDPGARYDHLVEIDATRIRPSVTWGTNPGMVIAIDEVIPERLDAAASDALAYMQLLGGERLAGEPVNVVFIGSCTNSRLSDLRAAAALLKGRKVAAGTRVLVVPGSEATRQAAEAEGLDGVFTAAGAEWREPGCSMCLGMNGDTAQPGDLVVSTSNRNFKGRQGRGVRTVLASPLTAAATAITGRITDPREFLEQDA